MTAHHVARLSACRLALSETLTVGIWLKAECGQPPQVCGHMSATAISVRPRCTPAVSSSHCVSGTVVSHVTPPPGRCLPRGSSTVGVHTASSQLVKLLRVMLVKIITSVFL